MSQSKSDQYLSLALHLALVLCALYFSAPNALTNYYSPFPDRHKLSASRSGTEIDWAQNRMMSSAPICRRGSGARVATLGVQVSARLP